VSVAAHLPIVDIGPLLNAPADPSALAETGAAIGRECRQTGFFGIIGHGVPHEAQTNLDRAARSFFALPEIVKAEIAMDRAGPAWRGWFPVGGELTAGRPDRKQGIYFGTEHPVDHPLVLASTPLHGANQFPTAIPELRPAVLDWLDRMRPVADAVLRGVAVGLGLDPGWFEATLTGDPTVLFRVFHYPPQSAGALDEWGVGEHTDYGLLTLLAQDASGGLEIRLRDGAWCSIAPEPDVLVCNLGDMLERLSGGRYRSTPHRVRNTTAHDRLSFPYFFDPSWDAIVPALIPSDELPTGGEPARWDGADVTAWEGSYGVYLTAKVAKVFPQLFEGQSGSSRGTISP
jgi:isopenicillin N synthase-like dioxygenase